jgi:hypothetical protein
MKKKSIILTALFIGTVIYTFYGILQLSRKGGPCNVGLSIIMLTPFLILCATLLAKSYMNSLQNEADFKPILFTFLSLSIWTYWFYTFSEDSVKESFIYLGAFEITNVLMVIVLFKKFVKGNKLNKSNS